MKTSEAKEVLKRLCNICSKEFKAKTKYHRFCDSCRTSNTYLYGEVALYHADLSRYNKNKEK